MNELNSSLQKFAITVGIISTILATSKDSLAQNLLASNDRVTTEEGVTSNPNNNKNAEYDTNAPIDPKKGPTKSLNIVNSADPVGISFNKITSYYPIQDNPEVAAHIANLQQHRNTTRGKIKKAEVTNIIKSIRLPNTRTDKEIATFIVGITELEVIKKGTSFADTFWEEGVISEEAKYYKLFRDTYVQRFEAYAENFNQNLVQLQLTIAILEENIKTKEENIKTKEENIKNLEESIKTKEKSIEEGKKIIEEGKYKIQENINIINNNLASFSIEELAHNQTLYSKIKMIKEIFQESGFKGSTHTEKLFAAIK